MSQEAKNWLPTKKQCRNSFSHFERIVSLINSKDPTKELMRPVDPSISPPDISVYNAAERENKKQAVLRNSEQCISVLNPKKPEECNLWASFFGLRTALACTPPSPTPSAWVESFGQCKKATDEEFSAQAQCIANL